MNENMTAVEWLFEQVANLDWRNLSGEKKLEIFERAKQMQAQQVLDFSLAAYIQRSRDTHVAGWQISNDKRPFTDLFVSSFGNKWYEVWTEGYSATGDSHRASLHGRYFAPSFRDAVLQYIGEDEDRKKYFSEKDGVMRLWGCRFFDNEADARKSFG